MGRDATRRRWTGMGAPSPWSPKEAQKEQKRDKWHPKSTQCPQNPSVRSIKVVLADTKWYF